MEKIKLIILENDAAYAKALARQIVFLSKEFSVSVKTDSELQKSRLKGCGLILEGDTGRREDKEETQSLEKREPPGGEEAAESIQAEESEEESSAEESHWVTIRLKRGSPGAALGKGCVSRYGRVSELVSFLLITYAAVSGRKHSSIDYSGKTKLIGFVSGSGGAGKTAAALTFCRILSREQSLKTLYLSFEGIDSIGLYMSPPDNGRSLGDFLYYLYSRPAAAAAGYLEAFLFRDECGVYSFYPSKAGNELLSLSEDELAAFFRCLLHFGEFDRIILDLPALLQQQIAFLLRSCGAVAIVSDGGCYSELRNRRMKGLLEASGLDEERLYAVKIERDETNFERAENGISISVHHRLGREMKALAERMEL